jgi:hypothetical protein
MKPATPKYMIEPFQSCRHLVPDRTINAILLENLPRIEVFWVSDTSQSIPRKEYHRVMGVPYLPRCRSPLPPRRHRNIERSESTDKFGHLLHLFTFYVLRIL